MWNANYSGTEIYQFILQYIVACWWLDRKISFEIPLDIRDLVHEYFWYVQGIVLLSVSCALKKSNQES
jgi:hypothetical protein